MSIIRYPRAALRFVLRPSYRSALWLRLRRPENLFQLSDYTAPDRYPELFALARRDIGDGADRSILSFGCSTGDEIFSLRAYFPLAELKGVDINRHSIAVCRRRLSRVPDSRITFEVADSTRAEPPERYDAIFCMAVFRHGSLADASWARCDPLLRFSIYERQVADIARCLKPGGLLFIAHSNFRFRDTAMSPNFELAARMDQSGTRGITPVFDRDNRRTSEVNYSEVGFRKIR